MTVLQWVEINITVVSCISIESLHLKCNKGLLKGGACMQCIVTAIVATLHSTFDEDQVHAYGGYHHKATICCILVSHQGLSPTFMRAGGYYHYTIIHPPQKRAIAISLSVRFLHSRGYVCRIELRNMALEGDISEQLYSRPSKSTYR